MVVRSNLGPGRVIWSRGSKNLQQKYVKENLLVAIVRDGDVSLFSVN